MHVWIIGVWFDQEWGPVEFHRRIVVLQTHDHLKSRGANPHANAANFYFFWKKMEERSPHISLVYFPIINSICMKNFWIQNILPTLNIIEYVIIFMCGRKKYEYPWIIKIKIIKLFTKQLKRCIKYNKIWIFITSRVFLEPPLNYNSNIILNITIKIF